MSLGLLVLSAFEDFTRFFSSCRPCGPRRHPNANTFLAMPAHGTICCEEPGFAGKVTCGVRNETSGQSWRSNTVVTNLFTAQNRNSKCGSGIQHKRLAGWRPKDKDFVPSVSNASLHWDGSTWSLELLTFLPNQPRQRPFYSCDGRGVGAFARNCPIAGSQNWTGGPVKLLCRENLALSTALPSVMSPSKVQL